MSDFTEKNHVYTTSKKSFLCSELLRLIEHTVGQEVKVKQQNSN